MKQTIESKLRGPAHLVVKDESHMHNVPDGAESHFNVFVVADAFEGKRLVARHQAVYAVLKEELAGRIHALALKTITPPSGRRKGGAAVSPQCLGGSKADRLISRLAGSRLPRIGASDVGEDLVVAAAPGCRYWSRLRGCP